MKISYVISKEERKDERNKSIKQFLIFCVSLVIQYFTVVGLTKLFSYCFDIEFRWIIPTIIFAIFIFAKYKKETQEKINICE